ncbi:heterokaryon incompatibility Het-C [Xylariales sp. PMI_506]|nr:heterokaryon incompatibility Het-C [Xylariales sp. PMI_506]
MLSSSHLIIILLVLIVLVGPASAFGAGEVPPGSEFKEYVWRHGDITEVLRFLPVSFITQHRFTQLQRRQIYFGNWLRDFSQVIDTTCLENVPEPILRAIVSVLALLEFGFATDEFEVTRERLGCYTHVEHIDNPRGYVKNAKEVDERLRGPVDPRELEIDPKTGMKNYIANSGQGWDTSADYVRRELEKCIQLGRKGRKSNPSAMKEAFIHLGAALHTLEDFSAHSNFIELCLLELGEKEVFPLVGDQCRVPTPARFGKGRMVPPLVTGTFGMLDIFHSLLGEADDMAVLQSKGSLGNLEESLNYGGAAFDQMFETLKAAISALQKLATENTVMMEQLEALNMAFQRVTEFLPSPPDLSSSSESDNAAGIMNPNLLWQAIEPIFYVHDRIKKWLTEGTTEENDESSPDETRTQLGEQTNALLFRFLGIMIESSVKELRNALRAAKTRVDEEAANSGSAAVYEDGSTASDPSHSDLSKDHFSNVLNRPAGLVATVTTNWTTQQVVKCWDNPNISTDKTIDEILSILHHPAFPKRKTKIQIYMNDTVKSWWQYMSSEEKDDLRHRLTRKSIQNRGHEDHELTVKDIEGKPKGPGGFPGSFPEVQAPPRKASFPLKWAINEATSDLSWALTTCKKSLTDPRGAAVDVASGMSGLVVNTARATITATRWVAGGLRDLVSRWWLYR